MIYISLSTLVSLRTASLVQCSIGKFGAGGNVADSAKAREYPLSEIESWWQLASFLSSLLQHSGNSVCVYKLVDVCVCMHTCVHIHVMYTMNMCMFYDQIFILHCAIMSMFIVHNRKFLSDADHPCRRAGQSSYILLYGGYSMLVFSKDANPRTVLCNTYCGFFVPSIQIPIEFRRLNQPLLVLPRSL